MEPSPVRSRSLTWKWVVIGCGMLFLGAVGFLGLAGYLFYRSASRNPADAEAVAREILDFKTFDRYSGQFSVSALGMKSAALAVLDDKGATVGNISLTIVPGKQNEAKIKEYRTHPAKRDVPKGTLEERPEEVFLVRGMKTPARVSVVTPQAGAPLLTYLLYVQGRSGAMVMFYVTGAETVATHDWVQGLLDTVK